jgi:NAD(P)-dependent dehydrogenase (short-subunit alcohol dehydrogenase family)
MIDERLAGTVAVVTGGTRGIERAVVAALRTAGANILISGHNSAADVAHVVLHLVSRDARSLPSRVEIRPAQPPPKG